MRKILKKTALALVLSLAVSGMAPAAGVALADERKTFTYAEQKSGKAVAELEMSIGERQDLKFIGVPDYQKYSLKWISTNESVAVVDRAGVITAMGEGTTSIRLLIGDETVYSSEGVIVHVESDEKILLGTSGTDTFTFKNLTLGQQVDLNFYGVKNWNPNKFTCKWTSSDASVATVNSYGIVTAKKAGIAVIQLSIINLYTGQTSNAVPVAIFVSDTISATPTPTTRPGATATPTPRPNATATPTPRPGVTVTPTPNPQATVTPVPSGVYVPYTVTVDSDHSLLVRFTKKVSFSASDIALYEVMTIGGENVEVKTPIEEVTLNADGTEMVVKLENVLTTSGKYFIKIGTVDTGKTFAVNIGAPNRLEIVYECLGQQGVAYAYDDEVGFDVPVTFSYRLYYGNIDVTESYKNNGYASFELVSPTSSDNVNMSGDQLYFYTPRVTALVRGIYSYYDDNGKEKEIRATASIQAREMADYSITHIEKWTIIDSSSSEKEKIDWDNPVHEVIAGEDNYKIVVLLADTYGYYYSTDIRGVDKSKNIYSTDDYETLFAMKGYSYSFKAADSDKFVVLDEGEIYPYESVSRAVAYVTLYNSDEWATGQRDLGAFQFSILAESKLNSVKMEQTSVSLVTEANNNHARFCQTDVPVVLYDQYGNVWDGDAYLEVSSNVSDVTDALNYGSGSPAYITKDETDGTYYLHIDAEEIAGLTTRTSVSFTVTESETRKKASVTVSLKKPTVSTTGDITVNSWAVGVKEANIVFGDGDLSERNAKAEIEIYQVSKNGYNVGLYTNGEEDEYQNECEIILQTDKTQKFTADKCEPGEVYVLVLGPDNQVVDVADSSTGLGVWKDSTGNVSVNITTLNNDSLSCLTEGRYTVTVTKINKVSGSTVSKTSKTTYFTVKDNTKDVTLKSIKGSATSITVSSEDDVKDIVLEMFTFNLGDSTWTTLTKDMITHVEYKPTTGDYIRIISIDFAVPADGKSTDDSEVTYSKTVSKINKNIRTGVD